MLAELPQPPGLRVESVRRRTACGWAASVGSDPAAAGRWTDRGRRARRGRGGTILELALPLAALGVGGRRRVAFFVAVVDAGGTKSSGIRRHRPIEVTVPDERFEARNWTA